MPGFLSGIFHPEHEPQNATVPSSTLDVDGTDAGADGADTQGHGDGGVATGAEPGPTPQGSETQDDSFSANADSGTALSLDPTIGIGMGGSYEDADGGVHSWQSDTQIGLHADVGATLLTALGTDHVSDVQFSE